MKKILAMIAVFFMMLAFNPVNAAVYSDVPADYWANTEITAVVNDGILTLTKNAFHPETEVSRSDFNSALLRALGHRVGDTSVANPFSDVDAARADYGDILLSSKIGLIYGYNDGTFKPDRIMTKAEAASVISHITKDYKGSLSSLNPFTDKAQVPAWAARQFAKTVDLGIYVNHPDPKKLDANKELNRAEAAVLLYKLKQSISAVKQQYVGKEALIGTEHLDVTRKAEVDEVQITTARKIVLAKNIIKGYFYNDFSSKDACIGDVVTFTAKDDVYTKEGTLVIPAGTTMKSVITSLEEKKVWNRNDKVTVEFESMTLPSGTVVPFSADILNHDGILTENRWAKPVAYTIGGAAIGAGAGTGVSAMSWHHHWGRGIAVGTPVGAALGLVTGLTTKGRTYKANEGQYVWLELTQDLSIPN
ncbi:S-layer homology domain-containing protein [bacterium]|nr:S-layer homology domain-containing protein [bacterium]